MSPCFHQPASSRSPSGVSRSRDRLSWPLKPRTESIGALTMRLPEPQRPRPPADLVCRDGSPSTASPTSPATAWRAAAALIEQRTPVGPFLVSEPGRPTATSAYATIAASTAARPTLGAHSHPTRNRSGASERRRSRNTPRSAPRGVRPVRRSPLLVLAGRPILGRSGRRVHLAGHAPITVCGRPPSPLEELDLSPAAAIAYALLRRRVARPPDAAGRRGGRRRSLRHVARANR